MNVVSLEIGGNDKQETREGYNILKVTRDNFTENGITFTNNQDGSFTLNGTSTTLFYIDLNNSAGNRFTLTQNKKYFLYFAESSKQGISLTARTSETTSGITVSTKGIRDWVKATSDNGFAFMTITKGTTFNNETFYPMVAESDVELEYEAYGAMPSPEFKSEIETVNTQANIIIENSDKTEQQTKTVDIQQEMLEGDYFIKEADGWKEVHTRNKKMLHELDSWSNQYGTHLFNVQSVLTDLDKASRIGLCNYFKYNSVQQNINDNLADGEFAIQVGPAAIFFKDERFDNVTDWKNWLAQKYEEGNPVYVWYKLATPTKLACTEKQSAQLEDLLNTSTYKNVTHIYSTDKVSPVIKIKYRKDIETMLNNQQSEYETRLSNIEKLLSTTTTSALLLDNLQTDLEKEVM